MVNDWAMKTYYLVGEGKRPQFIETEGMAMTVGRTSDRPMYLVECCRDEMKCRGRISKEFGLVEEPEKATAVLARVRDEMSRERGGKGRHEYCHEAVL